jgi:hypothetical protein
MALLLGFSAVHSMAAAAPVDLSSHILRYKDLVEAYYCKAIYDSIDIENYTVRDPQSRAIEEQCTRYIELNPDAKEMELSEIAFSAAQFLIAENRETINFSLHAIQDDFLAAEALYPHAPEVIWNAAADLYDEYRVTLAKYLKEQEQRRKNGRMDPLLQALHGAFILMSVTKLGEVGFRGGRAAYFGWKTLGPSFGIRSANALNLAVRAFGDNIKRAPKAIWIKVAATPGAAKQVWISSVSALKNPRQTLVAGKNLFVNGAAGSYAYAVNAVANNRWHLLAGGVAGISYSTYKMLQEQILDPDDLMNEALVAAFDQLNNEYEALVAVSKKKSAAEIDELAKSIGLNSKDDVRELRAQTVRKFYALMELAKGRNLNLPDDLFKNTLAASLETLDKYVPKQAPVHVAPPHYEPEKKVSQKVPAAPTTGSSTNNMTNAVPAKTKIIAKPLPAKTGANVNSTINVGTQMVTIVTPPKTGASLTNQPAVKPAPVTAEAPEAKSKVVTGPNAPAKKAKGAGDNPNSRN